jgi:hypothetical protein
MDLLTFPVLDAAEKALVVTDRKVEAIRAYYKRARVTLLNGHEAGPTLKTAKSIVELAAEGINIPMVVSEGSYRDLTVEAAQAAVIAERFAIFCAEDGMDPKNARKAAQADRCDACRKQAPKGESLDGVFLYAPDGMGYPTPVMFYCANCANCANCAV